MTPMTYQLFTDLWRITNQIDNYNDDTEERILLYSIFIATDLLSRYNCHPLPDRLRGNLATILYTSNAILYALDALK